MQKKDIKSYANFSFEDFLQDDFFMTSMNHPTKESITYWEEFRSNHHSNNEEFEAAKTYIESLRSYYTTFTADDLNDMRQEFIAEITKPKITIKKLVSIGASIAACLTLIAVSIYHLTTRDQEDRLPTGHFVAYDSASDSLNREVQLIVSDSKTIILDKEESVITYDTTGIDINLEERISQEETASYNQLIVPFGKRSRINLSDGSKVWVNSDSRLTFPVTFNKEKREIQVDGEIYIEVAPDADRPFIIKTKELDIRVLGTSFNVTAYDADPEKRIVLVSGAVQIKSGENETTLAPDQLYRYTDKQSQVEVVNTHKYISWINGMYYCENENLSSILQRLSRYYGIKITIDESVANVPFSGKLDLKDNLTDILKGIVFTLPVRYEENNGSYTISRIE